MDDSGGEGSDLEMEMETALPQMVSDAVSAGGVIDIYAGPCPAAHSDQAAPNEVQGVRPTSRKLRAASSWTRSNCSLPVSQRVWEPAHLALTRTPVRFERHRGGERDLLGPVGGAHTYGLRLLAEVPGVAQG